jgi:hypothetical protein
LGRLLSDAEATWKEIDVGGAPVGGDAPDLKQRLCCV